MDYSSKDDKADGEDDGRGGGAGNGVGSGCLSSTLESGEGAGGEPGEKAEIRTGRGVRRLVGEVSAAIPRWGRNRKRKAKRA
jgi:hypothetical protein